MTGEARPHVTVAAIAERDGRFLLVEEMAQGRLVLNQPAGHLEQGESLADAVRRETLEETGWSFEPGSLVGIYRYSDQRARVGYLRFVFSGTLSGHQAGRPLDPEIRRVVWLTAPEMRERRSQMRGPQVLACLEDYLNGRRHPFDLLHDLDSPTVPQQFASGALR